MPIQPLKNLLDHVKTFLKHTNEIIILDFHNFPQGTTTNEPVVLRKKLDLIELDFTGFRYTPDTHREFVAYLERELSEWIAPANNWSATCNDLWNKKKTLILSYNDDETVQQFPSILWTPVVQKWANVQNSDALKRYLAKIIEK